MKEINIEKYKISFCIFWTTGAIFTGLAIHDYLERPYISSIENGFLTHTVGPTGFEIAQLLIMALGYGAFMVPAVFGYMAYHTIMKKRATAKGITNTSVFSLSLLAIMNILVPIRTSQPIFTAGGLTGTAINELMFHYFDYTGSLLILSSILMLTIELQFHSTLSDVRAQLCHGMKGGSIRAAKWIFSRKNLKINEEIDGILEENHKVQVAGSKVEVKEYKKSIKPEKNIRTAPILPKFSEKIVEMNDSVRADSGVVEKITPVVNSRRRSVIQQRSTKQAEQVAKLGAIDKEPRATSQVTKSGGHYEVQETAGPPPLDLLNQDKLSEKIKEDPKKLQILAQAIEDKLKDFGVDAKVMNILLGPIITRFEIQPSPGTKASKITGLAKDLARSLSVSSVRVVEVITGKTFIGIEIPNKKRVTVSLKTLFESQAFQISKSALCLALGVDISGDPVVVDLAKMPHLLVAGTTGSGKSVGLNTLLLSLLYKTKPEDLKLILIDPKMLEFAVYEGIPHLLTPVVTDMGDASYALSWCVDEMERRYRLMAELGVRNISGYNEKVRKMPNIEVNTGFNNNQEPEYHTHLPYIVVIADEFADMMMMVGKKVEQLIARLAQKARAAGIHLILATQRPSVDVITGLIKANIPTRISFQVSSKIDSRTILDQQGAESLLGYGDMLYLTPGAGVPIRCHGAFVSDESVEGVVKHLRETGTPEYIELNKEEASKGPQLDMISACDSKKGKDDTLYDQIVDFVTTSRKVSTSSVQRRFRIGYNRASIMVEKMEAEGVVSAMDANGQRKVIAPAPRVESE